jgi:hypothetical protein
MPRLPIDYSKTIIYKIVCNDLNITDVYVGSTTDFIRRKGQHKTVCNNEKSKKYNLKVYQSIRQNGGWDNFTMIEIEKYPCNDSNEAHARERYYLELLNSTLNIQIPTRNIQEYYKDNKDKIKEYYEANKDKNKDKIKEYQKKYKEVNKDKLKDKNKEYQKKYKEVNKDKLKEYNEANKLKIAEYRKQYREANKDKIAEQKKEYYLKKKYETTP